VKNLDFAKQVKIVLKALGVTQTGLASKLGVSQGIISEFTSGAREPSKEFLFGLSKLGISLDWFLTEKGEIFLEGKREKHPIIADLEALIAEKMERFESRMVAMEDRLKNLASSDQDMYVSEPEPGYSDDYDRTLFVNNIAGGRPIYQSDDKSVYIDVPKRFFKTKPEDYYAGRVKGTSMTAAGIPDGCLVLIRISDTPRDGAIQVVQRQGEATLKRIREIPGKGWKICFEDNSGRYIEVGSGEDFQVQGDFIAVLPEPKSP
jgi:SOS-response transcriptional repressor LexA